jgi:HAD superfamily hydrolase (TIGR01509 family)
LTTNAVFYFQEINKSGQFSYIDISSENIIFKIKEKEAISVNACTGAYFFEKSDELKKYCQKIIDMNKKFQNEYYTSCVIDEMISHEKIFIGIELSYNHVIFLGTPQQTKEYTQHLYLFCFDLDGTLVNTDTIYLNVWKQLYPQIDVNIDIYKKYIQGNDDSTVLYQFHTIINKNEIEKISKRKDEYFMNLIENIQVIDGALEFIQKLYIMGHDIYIVTNCNRNVAHSILKYIGLSEYIDDIIIGNECPKSKPHPDPYLEAIRKSHFKKEKCIIFEDSKTGLLSAKSVFPKCLVGIESSLSKSELIDYGADLIFSHYTHLNYHDIIHHTSQKINILKKYIMKSLSFQNVNDVIITGLKLKGGYIADVIEIELKYENDIYHKLILKYESDCETNLTKMALRLNLYEREYYFYETIQKYISIKTPSFYGLVYDEHFKIIGVLLENLKTKTVQLSATIHNIDLTLKIIQKLAKMHSQFWNKDIQNIFPLLPKQNHKTFQPFFGLFIKENWDTFKKTWSFLLNETQLSIGEKIVNHFDSIQNQLSDDFNMTLCHGDVKYGNILFEPIYDTYEPYFIDWQYVSIGKGIQDIIFFLIESYEIHVLKLYKDVFLQYYYCELLKNGIHYKYDDYIIDLKNAASFIPFFVAIWFGTTPKDDLIDINFPYFYIQKYFTFLEYIYNEK